MKVKRTNLKEGGIIKIGSTGTCRSKMGMDADKAAVESFFRK